MEQNLFHVSLSWQEMAYHLMVSIKNVFTNEWLILNNWHINFSANKITSFHVILFDKIIKKQVGRQFAARLTVAHIWWTMVCNFVTETTKKDCVMEGYYI